jgi:hypothetical protein
MKTIFLLFLVFLIPVREYTVLDIKYNQLNYYIILLKDNKTDKLFCFETQETETNSKNRNKIKVGDVVSLKLIRKKEKAKFKISKKIKPFDDLSIYDDSLKVDKNYYCKELNGLYLEKTP